MYTIANALWFTGRIPSAIGLHTRCADDWWHNALGSVVLVSTRRGTEQYVEARLGKARTVFTAMDILWKSKTIGRSTKGRIFTAMNDSQLSNAWVLNASEVVAALFGADVVSGVGQLYGADTQVAGDVRTVVTHGHVESRRKRVRGAEAAVEKLGIVAEALRHLPVPVLGAWKIIPDDLVPRDRRRPPVLAADDAGTVQRHRRTLYDRRIRRSTDQH